MPSFAFLHKIFSFFEDCYRSRDKNIRIDWMRRGVSGPEGSRRAEKGRKNGHQSVSVFWNVKLSGAAGGVQVPARRRSLVGTAGLTGGAELQRFYSLPRSFGTHQGFRASARHNDQRDFLHHKGGGIQSKPLASAAHQFPHRIFVLEKNFIQRRQRIGFGGN